MLCATRDSEGLYRRWPRGVRSGIKSTHSGRVLTGPTVFNTTHLGCTVLQNSVAAKERQPNLNFGSHEHVARAQETSDHHNVANCKK